MDIGLNEFFFMYVLFQGFIVFIFEIEEFMKEVVSQNKYDEVMFGIVVIKFLLDILGEIEKVFFVNISEVLLGNIVLVELMLFRFVSNVKYRGRFFSEVCFLKVLDGVFLNEVSFLKFFLQFNKEMDMEEFVLEVF